MRKQTVMLFFFLYASITLTVPLEASFWARFCSIITAEKTLNICRKIGYVGAVCGASYLFMRYLNDELRNKTRKASIECLRARDTTPELKVETDGLIRVQGVGKGQGVTIRTEHIDPDRRANLFEEDQPAARVTGSFWQRAWQWLSRPPHRAYVLHTISVPGNYNISLTARNAHHFNQPTPREIEVTAIQGDLTVQTPGNVRLVDLEGNVTVQDSENVEVTHFARQLTVKDCSSVLATRSRDNYGQVKIDGVVQPIQQAYQLPPHENS
jgi:hypothetical protein